jgi:hypothetical protein
MNKEKKFVFVVNIYRIIGRTRIRKGALADQKAIQTAFENQKFSVINVLSHGSKDPRTGRKYKAGEVTLNHVKEAFKILIEDRIKRDIEMLGFVFMGHGTADDL